MEPVVEGSSSEDGSTLARRAVAVNYLNLNDSVQKCAQVFATTKNEVLEQLGKDLAEYHDSLGIMKEVKSMPEVFKTARKVSTDVNVDGYVNLITCFLLNEAIEEALCHHICMKIDFIHLLFRITVTNIFRDCSFIWSVGFLGKGKDMTEAKVKSLCKKMATLLENTSGKSGGKGNVLKQAEFDGRAVLLEGDLQSVNAYGRTLGVST